MLANIKNAIIVIYQESFAILVFSIKGIAFFYNKKRKRGGGVANWGEREGREFSHFWGLPVGGILCNFGPLKWDFRFLCRNNGTHCIENQQNEGK